MDEKETCTHEVHTARMTWRCIRTPGHTPTDLHYMIRVNQPARPSLGQRIRAALLRWSTR